MSVFGIKPMGTQVSTGTWPTSSVPAKSSGTPFLAQDQYLPVRTTGGLPSGYELPTPVGVGVRAAKPLIVEKPADTLTGVWGQLTDDLRRDSFVQLIVAAAKDLEVPDNFDAFDSFAADMVDDVSDDVVKIAFSKIVARIHQRGLELHHAKGCEAQRSYELTQLQHDQLKHYVASHKQDFIEAAQKGQTDAALLRGGHGSSGREKNADGVLVSAVSQPEMAQNRARAEANFANYVRGEQKRRGAEDEELLVERNKEHILQVALNVGHRRQANRQDNGDGHGAGPDSWAAPTKSLA